MTTQPQLQDAWDNLALAYDERVTDRNISLAEKALRYVDLGPGIRFLDVACGTGALSIPAARQGADVLAVDISPAMIEQLTTRAQNEGLSNVQGKVMDGHALEIEDNAFDLVGSQFGVMLFPDLQRGLAEMARVTKPGGKVLTVAFGPLPKVEYINYFIRSLQAAAPDAPGLPTEPPPPFQLADQQRFREEMTAAGLKDVRIEVITYRAAFESGRQLWDTAVSGNPIGVSLAAMLTEEQKQTAVREIDSWLQQRTENGQAVTHNTINVGIGTK